eukprot:1158536-Pelagomonas_calceolata.AAC.3
MQASVESLRGELKSALATVRREWEIAVETAAVRHAEQMAEGKAREDRLKSMRAAGVCEVGGFCCSWCGCVVELSDKECGMRSSWRRARHRKTVAEEHEQCSQCGNAEGKSANFLATVFCAASSQGFKGIL